MSEKYLRFRSARVEDLEKDKSPKYRDPLKTVCVVSFEFDRACLDKAHLGLICKKLDAAFLELLQEHGYQVPVEPPAPCKYEQSLFDEVGGA